MSGLRAVAAVVLVTAVVTTTAAAAQGMGAGASTDPDTGFSTAWTQRVDASQAEQPHWMTPLVTVTPRLEEEVRYDQIWQTRPADANFTNFGNNKGLELIPLTQVEVILGIPAYDVLHNAKGTHDGWADETFTVKYRIASANEEHGNYIVTAFLGVSVPTGDPTFTSNETVWTPTIAAGKGWGTRAQGFDVQSTFSAGFPDANEKVLGVPFIWNTSFQGHVFNDHFWPEVEVSWTHFHDGPNDGKDFAYYTVGAILGRFPITGRLRLALGAGYEQAITAFRTFNHAVVLTGRLPF
jgi:hypothetical protein